MHKNVILELPTLCSFRLTFILSPPSPLPHSHIFRTRGCAHFSIHAPSNSALCHPILARRGKIGHSVGSSSISKRSHSCTPNTVYACRYTEVCVAHHVLRLLAGLYRSAVWKASVSQSLRSVTDTRARALWLVVIHCCLRSINSPVVVSWENRGGGVVSLARRICMTATAFFCGASSKQGG